MERGLLIVLVFLVTLKGSAATHCACEIGREKDQKGFFKMGCDIWLSQRKCSTKKIIDRKDSQTLLSHLPKIAKGDRVELGFVGHWLNFSWTLAYVDKHVVPIAKRPGVSVVYDNTACSPMDNPEYVHGYLQTLQLAKDSQIMIKGSQGISVGMWDSIFWGNANFYAYASTEWQTPRFLGCEQIEDEMCSAAFQSGERGRCYDRKKKKLIWLYCKKPLFVQGEFRWQR